MTRYTAYWSGVGEVELCNLECKSHEEFRKFVLSQIVIRKNKEEKQSD